MGQQMLTPRIRLSPIVGICALSAAITTTMIGPAYADPCQVGGDSFGCGVGSPGGGSDGGGGSGNGGGGGGSNEPGLVPGTGGGGAGTVIPDPGPPQQANTLVLAEEARTSANLPAPIVHTSPGGQTYVRLKTGLWVDNYIPITTEPITSGGQTVVATATPKRVVWNLVESQISCEGPGQAHSTECNYTYRRSSRSAPGGIYHISATIIWGVHWTCVGACQQFAGDLDDLEMPSPPHSLTVSEIQANSNSRP